MYGNLIAIQAVINSKPDLARFQNNVTSCLTSTCDVVQLEVSLDVRMTVSSANEISVFLS